MITQRYYSSYSVDCFLIASAGTLTRSALNVWICENALCRRYSVVAITTDSDLGLLLSVNPGSNPGSALLFLIPKCSYSHDSQGTRCHTGTAIRFEKSSGCRQKWNEAWLPQKTPKWLTVQFMRCSELGASLFHNHHHHLLTVGLIQ